MKTSTLKWLVVTLAISLLSTQTFAQILVSTRIDVKGSRYSDQMWIFSVSTCTRNFDNGWDAYKMFGSSVTPQLFAWEANGNFQIDAVPDFNNTYLGFKTGEDSVYTLKFNHENVDQLYQKLYLIDLVANKTVDIFTTGTQYTFTAQSSDSPVKRFMIVTSLATPPVVTPIDTIVVLTDSIVVPKDTVITPTDPIVAPTDTTLINNTDSKDIKIKKVKITSKKNILVVENTGKQKGKLCIYNAGTGKKVKDFDFNAKGVTNLNHNLSKGMYVAKATTSEEEVALSIIIQ